MVCSFLPLIFREWKWFVYQNIFPAVRNKQPRLLHLLWRWENAEDNAEKDASRWDEFTLAYRERRTRLNESVRDSMNHVEHVMLAAKGRNRGTEFGCTFCGRVANLRTRKRRANTKSPIVILGNKRFREINLGERYLKEKKKITLIIYV